MADFMDYIRWRGDITFAEKGLNEVDALILNEMSYLELEGIVEGLAKKQEVTFREAYREYRRKRIDQSYQSNDPGPLAEIMAESERFGNTKLKYYAKETDPGKEVQFAAVTICLGDGSIYVAFRGTDNSIVGWREDFNLSYQTETAGQADAVRYLNDVMERTEGKVYVGGHSKGGNLAVYASSFCDPQYKGRIEAIFSNDGPGMNRNIAAREEYRSILDKVKLSIPESSLVGILLSNAKTKKIVKSNAGSGSAQHNPYTWQVMGDHLVEVDAQSGQSVFLNGTLNKWLDSMDDAQKADFTKAVFDALEASGAKTLAEINSDRIVTYNAIAKAAFQMEPAKQKTVLDALKELAVISRDALWDEAQKTFFKN